MLVKQNHNLPYFIIFPIVWTIGLIATLAINKGDLVIYYSQHRSDFWDTFYIFSTRLGEHYTYILAGIILLFIRFRHLITVGVTAIVVTIVSYGLKKLFAQPRPYAWFEMEGRLDEITLVDGIGKYVGRTSFPSGHTMSGFAVFTVLALITRYTGLKILFLILAILVGLSRVYLVMHFLQDVVFGSILGVLIAYFLFVYQTRWSYDKDVWYNRRLEWF